MIGGIIGYTPAEVRACTPAELLAAFNGWKKANVSAPEVETSITVDEALAAIARESTRETMH